MKRFLLLLTAIVASIGLASAQVRVVRGTVTSLEDGEPIIGASVVVKGNPTIGITTDVNGRFSLEVPANATHLLVSYVGKHKLEVAIMQGEMKITLVDDTQVLDEVIVTGYQTVSKKAFTGAASAVGSETVKAKFDANPINALNGNIPGLQLSLSSGQPGAPATIFVRGRNSLNSGTQPLYVIDGVPIESGTQGFTAKEGVAISPLSTLSSDDIESISVLKDAAATSIYGARAANGVIVITTKRGHGGFKLNFSSRWGASAMPHFPRSYHRVDKATYLEMLIESIENGIKYDKLFSRFSALNAGQGLGLDPNNKEDLYKYISWYTGAPVDPNTPGTDWLKEVTRVGFLQNYNLDISGGGESPYSPHYFIAFDYLSDKGIVIGKDLTRYSLRANLDQAPTSYFKYGLNTSLSMTTTNMGSGGGYFSDPITTAHNEIPIDPVYNEDGSFNTTILWSGANPVAFRSEKGDKNTQTQYRALISPFVTFTITDWLSFTSRYGLDAYILDDYTFWSLYGSDGQSVNGMGNNGFLANFYSTITNTFNVNKSWNDAHHMNILVGQEGQRTYTKSTYLEANNFAVNDLNDISMAAVPSAASSNRDELRLLSFFSNGEYNYMGRYFFSASFRVDASSRFSKKNRWAPFWSVGGKWRMAEEQFMANSRDYIQDFTIRTSYGTSGNQAVGSGWYAARALYDYGFPYDGQPGALFSQFEAPDLKWEQTAKFNLGLDMQLFNFITFGFDYYYHKTKDMVFAVPQAKEVGLPTYLESAYYKNIGELENQGIEFELKFDAIKTADTHLSFAFTGSHNKNKIIKLSTDKPIESTLQYIAPGYDIYTFKMKEWAGVDPATGFGMWYKNREESDETTFNYNEAAKVIVGKASPDFQGSFRTDLQHKGFDFSILFTYSIGGKIYGDNNSYDEHVGDKAGWGSSYSYWVADNRWKQPGDNAKVPLLVEKNYGWANASTRFLMNGSYLKIQNIVVGYTITDKALKKVGLSSARIYLSADNLYTFMNKNYRGFDPASVGANGFQWWNYPQPTKVTGGIVLSF